MVRTGHFGPGRHCRPPCCRPAGRTGFADGSLALREKDHRGPAHQDCHAYAGDRGNQPSGQALLFLLAVVEMPCLGGNGRMRRGLGLRRQSRDRRHAVLVVARFVLGLGGGASATAAARSRPVAAVRLGRLAQEAQSVIGRFFGWRHQVDRFAGDRRRSRPDGLRGRHPRRDQPGGPWAAAPQRPWRWERPPWRPARALSPPNLRASDLRARGRLPSTSGI